MKYAIIDISSSSISLLVAEGEKTFDVLLRERENISILHYMEGKISPSAAWRGWRKTSRK